MEEQSEEKGSPLVKEVRARMLAPEEAEVAAAFFKALSDPTRISIVDALQVHKWLCVSDLSEILGLSKSAISHQMAYLRLNKLVILKRDGQRVYYALCDAHVERMFALAIEHISE